MIQIKPEIEPEFRTKEFTIAWHTIYNEIKVATAKDESNTVERIGQWILCSDENPLKLKWIRRIWESYQDEEDKEDKYVGYTKEVSIAVDVAVTLCGIEIARIPVTYSYVGYYKSKGILYALEPKAIIHTTKMRINGKEIDLKELALSTFEDAEKIVETLKSDIDTESEAVEEEPVDDFEACIEETCVRCHVYRGEHITYASCSIHR